MLTEQGEFPSFLFPLAESSALCLFSLDFYVDSFNDTSVILFHIPQAFTAVYCAFVVYSLALHPAHGKPSEKIM